MNTHGNGSTERALPDLNISHSELKHAAESLILSASGWRKIFGPSEDSMDPNISPADIVLASFIADTFSVFVKAYYGRNSVLCLARDARPTGAVLSAICKSILQSNGINVRATGVTSAPEAMCLVKKTDNLDGLVYISASHNPPGHNGFKFCLSDGAVVGGSISDDLIAKFRQRLEEPHCSADMAEKLLPSLSAVLSRTPENSRAWKKKASKRYMSFILDTAAYPLYRNRQKFMKVLKNSCHKTKISIIGELNGSARGTGPDKKILKSLGVFLRLYNEKPGQIVHRIVPEGASLDLCRKLLEKENRLDKSFVLGYVPDNDGDRGNLVYYSEKKRKALSVQAQQVFALTVLSELLFLSDTDGPDIRKAVVINGPTSNRVNSIASVLSCSVFRAEVGEANVVNLAAKLSAEGYLVRIIGEGSNGGNITLPGTVRDPLNTLISIVKLLRLPCSDSGYSDYFQKWCRLSGQAEFYKPEYRLDDILNSLPVYTTTDAFEATAKADVSSDHKSLKKYYEQLFPAEWEKIRNELNHKYGIVSWRIINYEGTMERPGAGNRTGKEKGGFKVEFFDKNSDFIAFIWMRGSGTEPVFRVLADVKGDRPELETFLLDWHKMIISKADRSEL